mgnify:CR=1 FL=1
MNIPGKGTDPVVRIYTLAAENLFLRKSTPISLGIGF